MITIYMVVSVSDRQGFVVKTTTGCSLSVISLYELFPDKRRWRRPLGRGLKPIAVAPTSSAAARISSTTSVPYRSSRRTSGPSANRSSTIERPVRPAPVAPRGRFVHVALGFLDDVDDRNHFDRSFDCRLERLTRHSSVLLVCDRNEHVCRDIVGHRFLLVRAFDQPCCRSIPISTTTPFSIR